MKVTLFQRNIFVDVVKNLEREDHTGLCNKYKCPYEGEAEGDLRQGERRSCETGRECCDAASAKECQPPPEAGQARNDSP